jgi:ankyrin repeat protein
MKQAIFILALFLIFLAGMQPLFAEDNGEKFVRAAYDGDGALVKSLLTKEPGLTAAKDSYGDTALHCSSSEDHGDIVLFLLSKGASINAKNDRGFTPLHKAVWKGRIKTVKILLAKGADANAKTTTGATPLSIAREAKVAGDRKELIEVLRKYGAKN